MNEIDNYLSKIPTLDEKNTLIDLRACIKRLLPDSVECISYGMPAFRVNGKTVAGFAAFKNHLTFFPFSGSTLDRMKDDLSEYSYTKSGVHFTPKKPLPETLVKKIIQNRLAELE